MPCVVNALAIVALICTSTSAAGDALDAGSLQHDETSLIQAPHVSKRVHRQAPEPYLWPYGNTLPTIGNAADLGTSMQKDRDMNEELIEKINTLKQEVVRARNVHFAARTAYEANEKLLAEQTDPITGEIITDYTNHFILYSRSTGLKLVWDHAVVVLQQKMMALRRALAKQEVNKVILTVGVYKAVTNETQRVFDQAVKTPPILLSAGLTHTCAARASSFSNPYVLFCWGANLQKQADVAVAGSHVTHAYGATQLSSGATGRSTKAIVSGWCYNCAIMDDDKVKCWGCNTAGQLGDGSTTHRVGGPAPLAVVNLGSGVTAKLLAAGKDHTCATLNTGVTKCWGSNVYGQLGDGSTTNRHSPVAISFGTDGFSANRVPILLALGDLHSCAILNDNGLKCWGKNANGQLGKGGSIGSGAADVTNPGAAGVADVNLGAGRYALSVVCGSKFTCALLDNNQIKCWGIAQVGQLGLGLGASQVTDGQAAPGAEVNLGRGRYARSVVAAGYFACAILDNWKVKCWGKNQYGQLGTGDIVNRLVPSEPLDLGAGRLATSLVAGEDHACAYLDNNQLKCWGLNQFGQLGLGDTVTPHSSPQLAILP